MLLTLTAGCPSGLELEPAALVALALVVPVEGHLAVVRDRGLDRQRARRLVLHVGPLAPPVPR